MPAVDRHHRNVRTSQNKENQRPNDVMSPFRRTNTSPEVVQTPVKKDADDASGRDWLESLGVAKHPWGVEVKNTFIHYGSPLKTVSVVTPPKTVPSNFAPDNLIFEKLARTPLPRTALAATPSTAGVGLQSATKGAGVASGMAALLSSLAPPSLPGTAVVALPAPPAVAVLPQQPPSQPPQQPPQPSGATSGSVLRLSDFLPSPVAPSNTMSTVSVAGGVQQTATIVGQAPAPVDPSVAAMQGGWVQNYDTVMSMMPPVPPLPGPGFAPLGGGVAQLQPYGATFEAVQTASYPQPQPQPQPQAQLPQPQQDVVTMNALAGSTAVVGASATVSAGMTGMAPSYDATATQYSTLFAGDAAQMMPTTTVVAAPSMAAPAIAPPAPTQLPPQQDAGALPLNVSGMMQYQQHYEAAPPVTNVFELLQQQPAGQEVSYQFAPYTQPAMGSEWQVMANPGAEWHHVAQQGQMMALEAIGGAPMAQSMMPPPPTAAPGSRVSISVGHFPEPGVQPVTAEPGVLQPMATPLGEQPQPQQPLTSPPEQPAPTAASPEKPPPPQQQAQAQTPDTGKNQSKRESQRKRGGRSH